MLASSVIYHVALMMITVIVTEVVGVNVFESLVVREGVGGDEHGVFARV